MLESRRLKIIIKNQSCMRYESIKIHLKYGNKMFKTVLF